MNKAKDFFNHLRKDKLGMIGFLIIVTILLITIFAPYIAPYDPESPISGADRLAPSAAHLFGTDETGMDILLTGHLCGENRFDDRYSVDAFFLDYRRSVGPDRRILRGSFRRGNHADHGFAAGFSGVYICNVLVAVLGNSIENIIAAITFLNAPIYMRLVRSEALSYKTRPFIEAAKCTGKSSLFIIFSQLFVVSIRPALIQASVNVGAAILLTAGLSFIGAGVQAPTPEWGSMIFLGSNTIMTGQWWASFFPGISIAITVFGFALFGNFLRSYLNPEMR